MATRFPEAIPLRSIKSTVVLRELIKFFTKFGLPKEIQSDQGSNFLSKPFKQSLQQLGVTQVTSTKSGSYQEVPPDNEKRPTFSLL